MIKLGAQARLKKYVLTQGLCTGCGACAELCPYQVFYHDRTVQLFRCDLADGKCYAFCPRTPTDYQSLKEQLFDHDDLTDEIGPVKGFFLARAADAGVRSRAQHGGTVTALLELAMSEDLVEAALVSGQNKEGEPEGRLVTNKSDLAVYAKSRFTVSPTLAAFNRIKEEGRKKIGIVATPCQAQALAKVRTAAIEGYTGAQSIGLVIGLFCGWTLAAEKFHSLLGEYCLPLEELKRMDIPPGRNVLELCTAEKTLEVPLGEVESCIRSACRYCLDSTGEFADVSVGAARYGMGERQMSGWNQVLVRSRRGEELIGLAREKGVLEICDAPDGALDELKKAAVEKKRQGLENIVAKSGSRKNLLYLKNYTQPRDKKAGRVKSVSRQKRQDGDS